MGRPSFPTVISLLALFIALGGTSYAVIKLPAKSVGNRELKTNAVTSAKIRPRAIARSDLSPSARVGSRGPRGATGPAGAPGAPGGAAGDGAALEAWKPLAPLYTPPWRDFGFGWVSGQYRKDPHGRVYVRGMVAKGGDADSPAVDDVFATLPPGYRPTAKVTFAVATGSTPSGQLYGRVDLNPAGQLSWEGGATGAGEFVSLETISFWTD